MFNGLHNGVLNGKNCLKRSLFDQNFALQGLYFDQNFEKCTLVVGHFILNQIFKNVDKDQHERVPHRLQLRLDLIGDRGGNRPI